MAKPVTPLLTVDIIIETRMPGEKGRGIVLIERKNEPHGWALPGGFVDVGETVEEAALREAMEETGLKVRSLRQFGCYSDPKRDPRMHTAAIVFTGKATGVPRGADDAKRAVVCPLSRIPRRLCFDHRSIIADYARRRGRMGTRPN